MSTSRHAPHISVMSSVAKNIVPWCGRGCARAERRTEYATVPPPEKNGYLYSPKGGAIQVAIAICLEIRADMAQNGRITGPYGAMWLATPLPMPTPVQDIRAHMGLCGPV